MYEAQRERVEDAYKYAAYGAQTAAAATGSAGVAPAYGIPLCFRTFVFTAMKYPRFGPHTFIPMSALFFLH